MKARDIIPGWPRGKSTSGAASFETQFALRPSFIAAFRWSVLGDPLFQDDINAAREEERRKADMMEAYYEMQRIEARGPLYAETIVEKGYRTYLFALRLYQ